MKNKRIFGLFNYVLKPLLTALVLCVATNNAFGTCDVTNAPQAANSTSEGWMTITTSNWVLYGIYTDIKNSQDPLEITFGETPAPGPSFILNTQGVFFVDWGNGGPVLRINKLDTQAYRYFLGAASGATTIKIYSNTSTISAYSDHCPAITFNPQKTNVKGQGCGGAINAAVGSQITGVGGCLGCVFPTLSSGAQPLFIGSFANLSGLTSLPSGDFFYKNSKGITGEAADFQFAFMFHNDTGLSSNTTLPEGYFNSLTKAGNQTFYGMFSTSTVADITWPDGTIYCSTTK